VGANERLEGVSRYPLHVATDPSFTDFESEESQKHTFDVVQFLINRGADIKATDDNGDTAYDLVSQSPGHNKMIRSLLRHKMKERGIIPVKNRIVPSGREQETNSLRLALAERLRF
jgi:hypothetical protein